MLVFGPHNCRIHDNPLLTQEDNVEVIPVFAYDEAMIQDMSMVAARDMLGVISSCVDDLSAKFASHGIKLEVLKGGIDSTVKEFIDDLGDQDVTVMCVDTPLQPIKRFLQRFRDRLSSANIPLTMIEEEYITTLSKSDAMKLKPRTVQVLLSK